MNVLTCFKASKQAFAVALLFMTMTFSALAQAAPMCAEVFSQNETSPQEMYMLARNFHNAYEDFYTPIRAKAPMSKEQFHEHLKNLEKVTEEYFNASGIAFTKTPKKVPKSETSAAWPEETYSVYTITVDKALDINAKLLNGFAIKTGNRVKINFDPLMNLWNPSLGGYFLPANNSITFSYTAITFRYLGLSDVIRHEMQHAFEFQKILDGKHTLARFQFRAEGKSDKLYESFASLDELEAYSRELRLLKNPSTRFKQIAKDAGSNVLAVELNRISDIQREQKFLKDFAEKSVVALKLLRQSVESGALVSASFTKEGTFKVAFDLNGDSAYSKVELNLSGIDSTRNISQQIKEKSLAEIDWAEQRIEEIFKRLN
ncbi:hypothetical protein [Bdellovibrio sp. NC01]|uniref:hypothetical protein n=1 Tax=Bdellovibrio sp. NC01 TaxID=2220073 RepID=UPI0011570847|nr:hypothetical protein [Bdellovibrio sp. NC01]QDK37675.1 hypothetical protein DOE51_08810 [Bdellovibrio sp. NC01]